jgi:hypothetical protein
MSALTPECILQTQQILQDKIAEITKEKKNLSPDNIRTIMIICDAHKQLNDFGEKLFGEFKMTTARCQ